MNAITILTALRARGFTLTAKGDRLSVRPAGRLTDAEREAINALLPDLVAALTVAPPAWDVAAIGLMEAADAAVERHGRRGAEPAIQAAAARACEAYYRRDADELARACAEVTRLAAAPSSPDNRRTKSDTGAACDSADV